MLIARAPLRISFAGGGTDLEAYYSHFGGAVESATINKYFYVFLSRTIDDMVQISSSDFRTFERLEADAEESGDGDLAYLKSILGEFGVARGLSVFTASEVPPGTGLGSSSTVAVALVKALATLCQRRASKQDIAELASYIEIVKERRPIGLQDQFAASFGGLNWIEFRSEGTTVTPIQLSLELRDQLERSLMLFYTGASRNAATILESQKRSSGDQNSLVTSSLHGIKGDAFAMREALEEGRLHEVGGILHRSWQRKKQLADGVSNDRLDQLYEVALAAGAAGGKIAGAGGGGFLLLYCDPSKQEYVTRALSRHGLRRLAFHLDDGGAQVLVNSVPHVPGLSYPEGKWIGTGVAYA